MTTRREELRRWAEMGQQEKQAYLEGEHPMQRQGVSPTEALAFGALAAALAYAAGGIVALLIVLAVVAVPIIAGGILGVLIASVPALPGMLVRNLPKIIIFGLGTAGALAVLGAFSDAARSVLEASPLGDSIAERPRQDGEPAAVFAIFALITVAGAAAFRLLAGRARLRRESDDTGVPATRAVYGLSALRWVWMMLGFAAALLAMELADGKDLRDPASYEVSFAQWIAGLGLLAAAIAALTWWQNRDISPRGLFVGREAQPPAEAGHAAGPDL